MVRVPIASRSTRYCTAPTSSSTSNSDGEHMKRRAAIRKLLLAAGSVVVAVGICMVHEVTAQTRPFVNSGSGDVQITGTPGSPNATTTTNGKQLPLPDPKFGGVI